MMDPTWVSVGIGGAVMLVNVGVQWGMNRSARRDANLRLDRMDRTVTHLNTVVTTMAAQDPAVIQRLATVENEVLRVRDKQHDLSTFVTGLAARADERHTTTVREVAEVRGAVFRGKPQEGTT